MAESLFRTFPEEGRGGRKEEGLVHKTRRGFGTTFRSTRDVRGRSPCDNNSYTVCHYLVTEWPRVLLRTLNWDTLE